MLLINDLPPAMRPLRTLSPKMHRALGIRIAALEAAQRAAADEFEALYERSTELLHAIEQRQASLRQFRDILFNYGNLGRRHDPAW